MVYHSRGFNIRSAAHPSRVSCYLYNGCHFSSGSVCLLAWGWSSFEVHNMLARTGAKDKSACVKRQTACVKRQMVDTERLGVYAECQGVYTERQGVYGLSSYLGRNETKT